MRELLRPTSCRAAGHCLFPAATDYPCPVCAAFREETEEQVAAAVAALRREVPTTGGTSSSVPDLPALQALVNPYARINEAEWDPELHRRAYGDEIHKLHPPPRRADGLGPIDGAGADQRAAWREAQVALARARFAFRIALAVLGVAAIAVALVAVLRGGGA